MGCGLNARTLLTWWKAGRSCQKRAQRYHPANADVTDVSTRVNIPPPRLLTLQLQTRQRLLQVAKRAFAAAAAASSTEPQSVTEVNRAVSSTSEDLQTLSVIHDLHASRAFSASCNATAYAFAQTAAAVHKLPCREPDAPSVTCTLSSCREVSQQAGSAYGSKVLGLFDQDRLGRRQILSFRCDLDLNVRDRHGRSRAQKACSDDDEFHGALKSLIQWAMAVKSEEDEMAQVKKNSKKTKRQTEKKAEVRIKFTSRTHERFLRRCNCTCAEMQQVFKSGLT